MQAQRSEPPGHTEGGLNRWQAGPRVQGRAAVGGKAGTMRTVGTPSRASGQAS